MPTLVLQKGHCYRTTGSTGTTGEQDFATRVGDEAVRLLHGKGGWAVTVVLADVSSSAYRGDAFAAVHCDGSSNSAARGASVGYQTSEGQAFAQAFKAAYAARGWPGFRADNYTDALHYYYGVSNAVGQGNRRAIIVESGFMTNPDDKALLTAPDGAARVALALGDALGIPHGQEADMAFTDGTQDQIDDIQLRLASMHGGQWLPWPDVPGAPGGDLTWFQEQSKTALAPVLDQLAALAAQVAELSAKLDALATEALVGEGEITFRPASPEARR